MSLTHDDELPAWSMRRDDPRASTLAPGLSDAIDPDWAWGGSTGRGVRVAVLDSGIDGEHEFVGGVDRGAHVERDPDGEVRIVDGSLGDQAGHGTACAGIIRGVAPECELWDVCVLGRQARGSSDALIQGLKWTIDKGAQVVNLSLSTPRAQAAAVLHEIADAAYFQRTVLVASAHNLLVPSFPWRFSSVVSVASHDGSDPLEFLYNPEPPVEFFARGLNVEVAWLGGSRIVAAGNSFATAHLAGICALILGKHPDLTPFQLKSVLYQTAANRGQRT